MWNYFVNHWRLWLTRKTAILDCSPGSLLLSRVQLKIHHRQQSGLIQYIYSGFFFFFFWTPKGFFLLPLKQPLLQRVEIQPMVEIFMRKSAREEEPQHNQGLYSPGSRGKSVPVLLSDACLKHIKTKTGSVISQGEYVRRSLQDKSWGEADQSCALRQKQTEAALFQWLSLPSDGGEGGEKRHMLMENNRLINTSETAGAIGCMFAFNQRPEKCHHDNFGVCGSFQVQPPPPAGGGPKMQVRLSGLGVRCLVIETDRERWEAFIINMFEGEQTSLTPAQSGGRALISRTFLGVVTAAASCSACHCFVSVQSFPAIINIWSVSCKAPFYFACKLVEDQSSSLVNMLEMRTKDHFFIRLNIFRSFANRSAINLQQSFGVELTHCLLMYC